MSNKRIYSVNQTIFLIDHLATKNGPKAILAKGKVLDINKKDKTFTVAVYGGTYRKYSLLDYGRLFFNTKKEAIEEIENLPKPLSTVYQKYDNQIFENTVLRVGSTFTNGVYDLVLFLKSGTLKSTKEIGHSIFLNELDAIKN